MNSIDNRIKTIEKEVEAAMEEEKRIFTFERVNGEIQPLDYFETSLVSARLQCLIVRLMLLLAEKYPKQFTSSQVKLLEKDKKELERRIRSFKDGIMPSSTR